MDIEKLISFSIETISYGTDTTGTTGTDIVHFKWQYMARAGAGAKIRGKMEPEQKKNNFGSATL